MRALLLVLVLLNFSLAFGQGKVSYGLNFYVGVSGTMDSGLRFGSFGLNSVLNERRTVLPSPSLGAGLWGERAFGKNVYARLGIQYINSGNIDFEDIFVKNFITGERTSIFQRTYHFRVHQLQLPLEFRKEFGRTNIRTFLTAGAQWTADFIDRIFIDQSFMGPTGEERMTYSWDKNQREYHSFTPVNAQFTAGIGVRFNEQMHLQIKRFWYTSGQTIGWSPVVDEDITPSEDPALNFWHYAHQVRSKHRNALVVQISYAVR